MIGANRQTTNRCQLVGLRVVDARLSPNNLSAKTGEDCVEPIFADRSAKVFTHLRPELVLQKAVGQGAKNFE